MSRLRLRLSISLDGYAAGPNQSVQKGKDVALAGGANISQQYLNAGLVDEMQLHIVPILLGSGERLFDGVKDLQRLALVKTVAAPVPAPASTRTSSPAAFSLPSASGTRATRCSPGAVSLATPTFMGTT